MVFSSVGGNTWKITSCWTLSGKQFRQLWGFFFFSVLPCCIACGVLVPWPGFEPWTMAVKAPNLNHWTARKLPRQLSFRQKKHQPLPFSHVQILTGYESPHGPQSHSCHDPQSLASAWWRTPLVFSLTMRSAPGDFQSCPPGSWFIYHLQSEERKPRRSLKASRLKGSVLGILCFILVKTPDHHPTRRYLLRVTGVHVPLRQARCPFFLETLMVWWNVFKSLPLNNCGPWEWLNLSEPSVCIHGIISLHPAHEVATQVLL